MKQYDPFRLQKLEAEMIYDYGFYFKELKNIRKAFMTDEISRDRYVFEATCTISKLQTIIRFFDILGYSKRILEKCVYCM